MPIKIQEVLKKYFGYSDFKPGQEEIIQGILERQDVLGIMPTGGGKSLCYQIPALVLPGVTLVVSPLIALMKDQVDALNNLGVAAAYISSSLTPQEIQDRFYQASRGKYKLIYIAPERLASDAFHQFAETSRISLIAVDEAHCVSQWGHDFRPSYAAIAPWIEAMPNRPPVAAFTATATDLVQDDIVRLLALRQPGIHRIGFDRPNLHFSVLRGNDKLKFIDEYLRAHPGQSGIIYAATRKEVDNIYLYLQSRGVIVGRYHAGLASEERSKNQDAFLYDDIAVMVASNAFGLGIDKSNVRFVIHYNMPRSLESYYQEAGRAGRDGEKGDCILLYSAQDLHIQKFLLEQSISSDERKQEEYQKLQQMVDYCHTTRCLRQNLMEYFNQKDIPEECGNCGNCSQDYEVRDMTIEAQKIFSCILRMNQQYGATLIASVLKGSQSKRIKELKLNQLSTYGIMKDQTLAEIGQMIHILAAEDYLFTSGGQYPILRLQQKAVPVLRSQARVMLRLPPKLELPAENTLFQALCALRQEIAKKEQVPPYIIFHDKTLKEMSIRLPGDSSSLLSISGVGEVKMQKYGQQFLDLICRLQPKASGSDTAGIEDPKPVGQEKTPSHLISWNLYQEGKTLPEIARERKMTLLTVQDHILRAAREGCLLDWDAFILPEQESLILKAIENVGAEKLKPIKEVLPEEISYFVIKAFLCKHQMEKAAAD